MSKTTQCAVFNQRYAWLIKNKLSDLPSMQATQMSRSLTKCTTMTSSPLFNGQCCWCSRWLLIYRSLWNSYCMFCMSVICFFIIICCNTNCPTGTQINEAETELKDLGCQVLALFHCYALTPSYSCYSPHLTVVEEQTALWLAVNSEWPWSHIT